MRKYTSCYFLFKSLFSLESGFSSFLSHRNAVVVLNYCNSEPIVWSFLPKHLLNIREKHTKYRRFSQFLHFYSEFVILHHNILQLSFQIYFLETRDYYKE